MFTRSTTSRAVTECIRDCNWWCPASTSATKCSVSTRAAESIRFSASSTSHPLFSGCAGPRGWNRNLRGGFLVRTFARIAAFCLFVLLTAAPGAHAQNVRTIFLVRHADKVSDETDALLSDAGHRRAECLANTLADANIQQISTSDLQRTQQTAAPLAEQLHFKPVAIPLSNVDDLSA